MSDAEDDLPTQAPPLEFADGVFALVDDRDPDTVLALVSGGNDSTTMLELAAEDEDVDVDGVLHVNTGIGVELTRQHVREECQRHGLPYIEAITPKLEERYGQLYLENGAPSPATHRYMYRNLKERVFDRVYSSFPGRIVFLSGARKHESRKRAASVPAVGVRDATNRRRPRLTWASPVAEFTGAEMRALRRERDVPPNDVAELLDMSGECACNAYGSFWDLGLIWELDVHLGLAIVHLMLLAEQKFARPESDVPVHRAIYGWHGLHRGTLSEMVVGELEDDDGPSAVEKRAERADDDDGQFRLDSLCSTCNQKAACETAETLEDGGRE